MRYEILSLRFHSDAFQYKYNRSQDIQSSVYVHSFIYALYIYIHINVYVCLQIYFFIIFFVPSDLLYSLIISLTVLLSFPQQMKLDIDVVFDDVAIVVVIDVIVVDFVNTLCKLLIFDF